MKIRVLKMFKNLLEISKYIERISVFDEIFIKIYYKLKYHYCLCLKYMISIIIINEIKIDKF